MAILSHSFVRTTMLGSTGLALLAACLSRPVVKQEPTTKANFITTVRTAAVDKIDILLAIDNSSSMGDKQNILAKAIPKLITRLVTPNCVKSDDASGACLTKSDGTCQTADVTKTNPVDQCPMGSEPEFKPITDMHIGVISSSLGAMGGDNVPDAAGADKTLYRKAYDSCPLTDPGNPTKNDFGELVARASEKTPTTKVAGVNDKNFVVWFPTDASKGIADKTQLETVIGNLVRGLGQTGCGLEAQLESIYKFLIMPDPWQRISITGANINQATGGYEGLDETILAQRKAFLRPDSLVAVVMLTDEDDSSADPLAIGGQGWNFQASSFSPYTNDMRRQRTTTGVSTFTAPRGTASCDAQPAADTCTSCGFQTPATMADSSCQMNGGYYGPTEDDMNVRFFHMKQRYGVDPQYPLSRYVSGFRSPLIPDRASEHEVTSTGALTGKYLGTAKCTNPLFAAKLYGSAAEAKADGADLCNLPRGTRGADLIYFALVGGVPNTLLFDNANTTSPVRKANIDWTPIIGTDPLSYNYAGQDAHMQQSTNPRGGLPAPAARGNNGTDPVNGREWNTNNKDLQYACTFPLAATHPDGMGGEAPNSDGKPGYSCGAKTAGTPADIQLVMNGLCDCDTVNDNPPLCDPTDGARQVRAKAYPTVRELTVVKLMGDQGIASSLCPLTITDSNGVQKLVSDNPDNQFFGYNPAVSAIVDRLKNSLANQCLPFSLTADNTGNVPCVVVETLPDAATGGDPQAACDLPENKAKGLVRPNADVLNNVRNQQFAEAGDAGGASDLLKRPVCQVSQIVKPKGSSCKKDATAGWCYVETNGTDRPAGNCGRAIQFSEVGNPGSGVRVDLQCINQYTSDQAAGAASSSSSGAAVTQ